MNYDTPLTEAAAFLPRDSATMLMHESPAVQEMVVSLVRNSLAYLEALDVVLDPIQRDAVIDAMVVAYSILSRQLTQLAHRTDPGGPHA